MFIPELFFESHIIEFSCAAILRLGQPRPRRFNWCSHRCGMPAREIPNVGFPATFPIFCHACIPRVHPTPPRTPIKRRGRGCVWVLQIFPQTRFTKYHKIVKNHIFIGAHIKLLQAKFFKY